MWSFDIETNQRDKKMYKTISLFVLLGLLSGCNYEQRNVTNAVLDQPAAKMTLQELEKYTDTAVRNSLNDSCWFFLTEKDYETIFTVPESGMSAYLTRRDSSSIDNSVSEKNN
jgi:outer membrane lipopolysaccharide assembly protein LptE/RlpB